MPSSKRTASFVEQTTLPKITIRARGGEPQMHAYVNASIIGSRPTMLNGNFAYPLYYLSLVAMRGQGTTLQGIFARLVSNHSRDVAIEGIGDVVLAHHQSSVLRCGYTIHWNFEQAELAPTRDLHAIIESRMLTMVDPIQGTTLPRQREAGVFRSQHGKKPKERVSLSTLKKSSAQQHLGEVRSREQNPLFLLLAPGATSDERASMAPHLHFAFLDQRVPWPLDPSWAPFLWERGLETQEIEPLRVWCFTGATQEEEGAHGPLHGLSIQGAGPVFSEAYFCRPKPVSLLQDVQQALAAGHGHLHTYTPAMPLSIASHQREQEPEAPLAVHV